ncbi:type-F conjugative transfer system pilin assembly protein TraF [Enterobacter ludwigii]|uniref:type-F conjugative transfer system pilin assembly protein TraF n=1 Tax=Enterobacter ludwigii TaxID=299767 RepID=UPI002FD6388C
MMRTRLLLIAASIAMATGAIASPDVAINPRHALEEGWHWYKDPAEIDDDDGLPPAVAQAMPPAPMTASEQKALLQKETQEALDNAILYPSPENYRRYAVMKEYWINQATDFTQSGKKALLQFPELNYNLVRSHYNGSSAAQQSMTKEKETLAVSHVAERYGVMFFYRGENPVDSLMAGVIKTYCEERGISVTGVSVDGKLSEQLPNSHRDSGQAEAMIVKFFPATFLVDPKTRQWQPLAWGFMAHDDLDRQVVNVLTDFKPDY